MKWRGGKNKWKGYIVLIYSIEIVDQINEMKIDLKKEKEKGKNEEWRMKNEVEINVGK